MEPIVFLPGEGEVVGSGPTTAVLKATKEATRGGFSMSEATIAPRFAGPPPHFHNELTDTFYVLEGTLTVRVGDQSLQAPAGSFVCAPPGTVHTFSNTTDSPVRFLNINSPAGWEDYLRDLAEILSGEGPPDPDAWREVMARYDFQPAE